MARHRRFEELPVWQAAIELASRVFDLTEAGALAGHAGLKDQLERAVVSISNNIAEGWERGTHEELLTFLYYARGSAGETRSMLRFLEGRLSSAHGQSFGAIVPLADDTGRQLGAWLESLKGSDDRGPRYRTEATRRTGEMAARQARFDVYLQQVREDALTRQRHRRNAEPPSPDDPPT